MTRLMSDKAIRELRELLAKEINPKTIQTMTDEEISSIGFFFLEIFQQGFYKRADL
jgi:hypothetical protein